MEQARVKIQTALTAATNPAVLCSFGKDSMLLLALAREVVPTIPVIWFRTGTPEHFAKRVIVDWDLTVVSWGPDQVYPLVQNSNFALVSEYAFGSHRLPVIQDVVPGQACAFNYAPRRTHSHSLPFDRILIGWKDCDTHWIKGGAPLREDGFCVGDATVVAPIRHLTDEQVRAAIISMNIPYEEVTDQLPLCTACMTPGTGEVYCLEEGRYIPRVRWEADRSLTAFRHRFQLEDTNGQSI